MLLQTSLFSSDEVRQEQWKLFRLFLILNAAPSWHFQLVGYYRIFYDKTQMRIWKWNSEVRSSQSQCSNIATTFVHFCLWILIVLKMLLFHQLLQGIIFNRWFTNAFVIIHKYFIQVICVSWKKKYNLTMKIIKHWIYFV